MVSLHVHLMLMTLEAFRHDTTPVHMTAVTLHANVKLPRTGLADA